MVSVQARKEQTICAIKRGLTLACTLLNISRSNLTYVSRMPVKDEAVVQKLSGQNFVMSVCQPNGLEIAWKQR